MNRIGVFVLLIGLVLAPLWPQPNQQKEAQAGQQEEEMRKAFVQEYKIGPRDLLEIKVFEYPEFNQTVRVSEDGSITLPLLGNVQIGGQTKDEVEKELAGLLEARFIRNAQVTVFIKEYQSSQVAIIGAVERPGTYELLGRQDLLQMVSKAGGFKENAADEIFVLRENKGGISVSIAIDLEDLVMNGNPKLNIPLQPNDVVNVPVDRQITVYVFGEVKSPGALKVKMSERITVLQAIAQAGGLTEDAKKSGITIKSIDKSGKETKMKLNLRDIIKGKKPDIRLKDGDVVIVPGTIL